MRILLTGGSGFIGRNLIESLGRAHDVVAPSHSELDVANAAAVDSACRTGRFDAVIHAAVEGGPRVLETTVRGLWNVVRNSDKVGRILYFGSGAEFGKHRDLVRVREDELGKEVPRDDYGFAKLVAGEIARRHRNVVNLRLFGVYGPHEGHLFKFVSNTVVKVLLGLDILIKQDVRFDYLWVGDLAAIVERFLISEGPESDYNVTPDESATLSQIAHIVRAHIGGTCQIRIDRPGWNFEYTGCNDRLKAFAPDLMFTELRDGVGHLTGFYRTQLNEIDREEVVQDEFVRRARPRETAEPLKIPLEDSTSRAAK